MGFIKSCPVLLSLPIGMQTGLEAVTGMFCFEMCGGAHEGGPFHACSVALFHINSREQAWNDLPSHTENGLCRENIQNISETRVCVALRIDLMTVS